MFKRILCATDFSETSESAWALACELAKTHQSDLVLAHVFTEFPVYPEVAVTSIEGLWGEQRQWVQQALDERVRAAAARGLRAHARLDLGTASEGIIEAASAEHADLIVIGTHGRTGITRLVIGSVAERVVRAAPCPVLTVKPAPPREAERAAA